MARDLPDPGQRVSLRRVRDDGEIGDLVGFVVSADDAGLTVQDLRGRRFEVAWERVVAWRRVGVARGRDPLRTPLAELDALAGLAGVAGEPFVARLSDLLAAAPPPPVDGFPSDPPVPAELAGEWVTVGGDADLLAVAWWAAHRGARSIQVRTSDPAAIRALLAAGFTRPG